MIEQSRRYAFLLLFLAAMCLLAAPSRPARAADGQDAPAAGREKGGDRPLFIIERSKNANVVHYDARLNAEGKFDAKQPVVAYWILLADKGQRQDLNWIERKKAYGFDVKPAADGNGYQMTVVAAPERAIRVTQEGEKVHAEMEIGGQPAYLEKMYINSTDGLTGPKVHYIELRGKDKKTQEERVEKVVPD